MNKHLKTNNGSALLIAVAVLMIFTVLGLSLITLTANGLTKNESRENIVHATDLADKGIEFAVNDLQKKLIDEIKKNPMGKTDFYLYLNSIFSNENLVNNNLKCPASNNKIPENIGYKIPGENNSFTKVCIEKAEEIKTNGVTEEKDRYKRLVTFRSEGWVNQKKHTTYAQVNIGTDAIPDQLRYAVSSNNNGSLHFHGGVEVTGDIKSAANIHISKKAYSGWNYAPSWHNSVALKLNPTIGSASSKIIFSKPTSKLFYYNQNLSHNSNGSNKGIVYSPTKNNTYDITNQNQIKSLLTRSDKINVISKDLPEDTVNVQSKVESIYNENKLVNPLKGASITGTTSNLKRSKESITMVYDEACLKYSNKWPYQCTQYGLKDTELSIGPSRNSNTVEIQGTYFINGDVEINNVALKSNAVLYVNGNVNIRFSTLTELEKDSSLIIFASGTIFIANISEYLNTPSTIKGFFYSQSDMTLYGVGSNIKIIGGLASKNLYLTALRGNVSENNFNISENTQLNSNSRLQIIYDENIIKQYTDFRRDEKEEFITQLNEPETLNRY